MVYSTRKEYLPANITCKILDHYLDVPGIYDCKS